MSVRIIINPVSGPARRGRGAERLGQARRALDRLRIPGEACLTERSGHAHELALEAVSAGVELVLAWGGDGTINEVGRALVQREGEGLTRLPDLGIIPGGSGNGLARELKIPFDPALAIERAFHAKAREIDAGDVSGHVFFNVAGIGLDAHVAGLVATRMSHRGLVPYITATLGDLLRYPPSLYSIDIDGRREERQALVIALANSRQYGFGAQIAPAAKLDDGLLDLIAIEDRRLLGNMARVPSLFVGRLDRRAGVHAAQIRELTIRASSAMLFHVDGEVVQGSDTLTVRVLPRALRIRG